MKNMVLVTIVLALSMAVISCGGKKKEVAIEEKAIAVTVAPASVENIVISRTYTGTLQGDKQAMIYASIPEAIVALPVSEGSQVQAGQAIVLLDKEGPSSHYHQAEAAYLDAKDNYEKMGRLFEQGAISEQAYNGVKTNFDISRANFEAAKQQVELTSPISGVLTDLAVNVGQYAPMGVPVATVAQIDRMRLDIYIDGRGAGYLHTGQPAQISGSIDSDTLIGVTGTVSKVARSADPDTRLFGVTIEIDNKDRILRPGMFVRATINIAELDSVLTIQKESVFIVDGVSKVYKLINNRAVEQAVQLGESSPALYQVTSGVNLGENIIVLGRAQVSDGSLVNVISDSSSATTNSR
jgi:membrane fusion protein, multidrug efflux system